MSEEPTNITWHAANLPHQEREQLIQQKGCVVWFTGLSGSGKSTVARAVEEALLHKRKLAYVLDGDNLRMGLNSDLGFTPSDRTENIRRVGNLAQLFADSGVITLTAFISPYRRDRLSARELLPIGRFLECYVSTTIEACEARDPKGLYRRARLGEIKDFTGISAPYEAPVAPEITLPTHELSLDECVTTVVGALEVRGLLH